MSKREELELSIRTMISTAGSGHYASSMSALDIMYPLFYEERIAPHQFILSKGHAAPALYAILHDLGILDTIADFRHSPSLPGHPSLTTPGVTASSGSLGMGISKAIGLAHANPEIMYHVLIGDGELQEGQNWEAILYIIANAVANVTIHVDCNDHQYSGQCLLDVSGWDVAYPFIILHTTEWREDNSYLTSPNPSLRDVRLNLDYYATSLIAAMKADANIVVLNADLEHDFHLTDVKSLFPTRYIQCGISEAHMVSMANGLALAGKLPICHTFGAFYRRAHDQIWNNYCDQIKAGYVAGLNDFGGVEIGMSHFSSGRPSFVPYMAFTIGDFFAMLPHRNGGVWLDV